MGRLLHLSLISLCAFMALTTYAAPPAPLAKITVAAYRPAGLMPADLYAFLSLYADKLTPKEKADFTAEYEIFNTVWKAWEFASEKEVRQRLNELASPDAKVVANARQRLNALMQTYPSSFTVFRKASAALSPQNAIRLTEMCMDYHAARDIWLKYTQDMTTAIKANAFKKTMLDAASDSAKTEAIAVRQSLKQITVWKNEITKKDDPQLLTLSRLMDFYERTDARNIQPLITQAPITLGDEDFKKIQHEILARLPKKPQVVAE